MLNELEANLDFTDPASMWAVGVHSSLHWLIQHRSKFGSIFLLCCKYYCNWIQIKLKLKDSFDKNQKCIVCGGVGHDFNSCIHHEDDKQVHFAYIWICVTVRSFLKSIDRINGNNQLNSLATARLHSVKSLFSI